MSRCIHSGLPALLLKRKESARIVHRKVKLLLRNNGSQQLQLLSVPLICEPLVIPPVQFPPQWQYSFARAWTCNTFGQQEEFQPDILIGSGYYWDIITGETIRGRCGPIAIRAVHMKLIVIRFSIRIQSESNWMRIDRVHMAQQVSRFEANCGKHGCHK